MKKVTKSGEVYETSFAHVDGRTNPRLAPPRGDVLSDKDCRHPLVPMAETKLLEERYLAWLRSQRQPPEQ